MQNATEEPAKASPFMPDMGDNKWNAINRVAQNWTTRLILRERCPGCTAVKMRRH